MIRITLLVIGVLFAALGASAQETAAAPSHPAWPNDVLRQFASLPIQDGGRIKPLDTYANVRLLEINGKRSCKDAAGKRLSALEWMLDCLYFPDAARQYKVFLIESPDTMAMLSLESEHDRDRFSFAALAPARQTLMQLAMQFSGIPDKQRTPAQSQILNLAHNVREFELLTEFPHFARHAIHLDDDAIAQSLFGGMHEVRLSDVLAQAPAIQQEFIRMTTAGNESGGVGAMRALLNGVDSAAANSRGLALIPPPASSATKEWHSPASLLEAAFSGNPPDEAQLAVLRGLEGAMAAMPGSADLPVRLGELTNASENLAEARGEYRTVPLELVYYKAQFFWYSLYLFVLSFLAIAVSWMLPKNRIVRIATIPLVAAPTVLLVCGIVMRCIIRERPPVTTLYETILFITAVAVVVALFIEYVNRQRVALSLAAILGTLGVFLANKYELVERGDTMPSMIAVLDTNFWLSTHVTTVTMGYSAGLLASAIAHVYVIGAAIGLRRTDPAFYRSLARMTYGVMCFGLLFATVGTVLGGIWANNSWGRFWGWDPKENGALMIVLWLLIVLHARIAGYIRDFGIVVGAICCGMIVAFSWFGVNLLGVGLHSYGFTSGIASALKIFYMTQAGMLCLAGIVNFVRPAGVAQTEVASRGHVSGAEIRNAASP